MESPNRGMSGGAMHQVGSQGVTVPDLTHPWPTLNMGWDEGGVLPLVQSQEVQSDVLFELEQRVPALEHPCDCSVSCKVGRYNWHTSCLDASQCGENVCKLVLQIHTSCDVVEMDTVIWVVLEPRHQHFANGQGQVLS
jgi:hypothetical protein